MKFASRITLYGSVNESMAWVIRGASNLVKKAFGILGPGYI